MSGRKSASMRNPASVFCVSADARNRLEIRADPRGGGERGVCVFPDGRGECEEWAFMRGECAPSASVDPTAGSGGGKRAHSSGTGAGAGAVAVVVTAACFAAAFATVVVVACAYGAAHRR